MNDNDFKRELGEEFDREFARIFGLPMPKTPQPDPEADMPEVE